jgi:hypothetical protein
MRKKRPYADMKRAPRKKTPAAPISVPDDIGKALQRALRDVRRMTAAQRRQSLIDTGILTKDGELAEIYR